jgi:hypothetical protein
MNVLTLYGTEENEKNNKQKIDIINLLKASEKEVETTKQKGTLLIN